MNVCAKYVKLKPNAHVPTQGSCMAAGYDLYACIPESITVDPFATAQIGTGLAIQPPVGYFGAIFARSGLATKQSLRPANCVGVCDEDYTGEYIVALHNDSYVTRTIQNGDRIAQLVFLPYVNVEWEEAEELEETTRGDGGFGSTGQ